MSIIIKRKESKWAEKSENIYEKFKRFCQQLGGKFEDLGSSDFGCVVDPAKAISSFKEFERLVDEARSGTLGVVTRMYFGSHDSYFAVFPGMGYGGFILAYKIVGMPKEGGNKFQEELKSELYNFMNRRGLGITPEVEYGGDYIAIRVTTPLTKEGLDNLTNIARAMLDFKPKLHELMKKYGVKVKTYPKFM